MSSSVSACCSPLSAVLRPASAALVLIRVLFGCLRLAVSCVRSSGPPPDLGGAGGSHKKHGGGGGSIGFLDDTQRMNVALTRAKYALWVVGNKHALAVSKVRWCVFARWCGMHAMHSRCVCARAQHWSAFVAHVGSKSGVIDVPDASSTIASLRPRLSE